MANKKAKNQRRKVAKHNDHKMSGYSHAKRAHGEEGEFKAWLVELFAEPMKEAKNIHAENAKHASVNVKKNDVQKNRKKSAKREKIARA